MDDFKEAFKEQSAHEYAASSADYEIIATPFKAFDPATLPRREILFNGHYVRKFISVTAGTGGSIKTQLLLEEAISMATGVPILGAPVPQRLRVWHYNLEDPLEELQRRVAAICQHFNINMKELEGWLFLDSGRQDHRRLIVGVEENGQVIATPQAKLYVEEIRQNGIDVSQVDPFVKSHRAPENDNGKIDQVMEIYGDGADQTDCAIELAHHIRKTGSDRVGIEDVRGGSAIIGAARTVRMISRMNESEARLFGIAGIERLRYFRIDPTAKANMMPPADHADWMHMVSVELPNSDPDTGVPGDNIGVPVPWIPSGPLEGLTYEKINELLDGVDRAADNPEPGDALTPFSPSKQAGELWIGHPIQELLEKNEKQAAKIIETWTQTGVLVKFTYKNQNRKDRVGVRSGVRPGSTHD